LTGDDVIEPKQQRAEDRDLRPAPRPRAPLAWQVATVTAIRTETPDVKTFTLALPDWMPHLAGQHYDIRLTAEDGYTAERSYSVASPPSRQGEIDLAVERIEDGEVSPFLHDTVVVGDRFEVRGPIGGFFVWTPSAGGPLLLVGGGSGVVPLVSILREREAARSSIRTVLLYSARNLEQVIYRDELMRLGSGDGLDVVLTLTRSQPADWTGYARRIDRSLVGEVLDRLPAPPLVFVCGPTLLVEAVAEALVGLGLPASRVRTERFGPTGT
jgi:ferredoxin-NADP reductase